eukprot:57004-Pelagomonas_calceolata.AAC.1
MPKIIISYDTLVTKDTEDRMTPDHSPGLRSPNAPPCNHFTSRSHRKCTNIDYNWCVLLQREQSRSRCMTASHNQMKVE